MAVEGSELLLPTWYPTHDELRKRPKFIGALAIDPPNPHEIDDAIQVTPDGEGFEVHVHVADGGLLAGQAFLAEAAEQGWSEYFINGEVRPLLPDETRVLDLTATSKIGVPAITISFGLTKSDKVGDVSITKSRVRAEGTTYAKFLRQYRKENERAGHIVDAAILLAEHLPLEGISIEHFGEDVVGRYMVVANFIVADQMESAGIPWLFRNNSKNAYMRWRNKAELQKFEEMRVAIYGGRSLPHDGLRLKRYCHFTSPLRRYPDLVNHINLTAFLNEKKPPFSFRDIDTIAHDMTKLYIHRSRNFRTVVA